MQIAHSQCTYKWTLCDIENGTRTWLNQLHSVEKGGPVASPFDRYYPIMYTVLTSDVEGLPLAIASDTSAVRGCGTRRKCCNIHGSINDWLLSLSIRLGKEWYINLLVHWRFEWKFKSHYQWLMASYCQMKANGHCWWEISIGSGNAMVCKSYKWGRDHIDEPHTCELIGT